MKQDIKGGKRTPRQSSGLTIPQITVLWLCFMSVVICIPYKSYIYNAKPQIEEMPVEVIEVIEQKPLTPKQEIVKKIVETFPENPVTMVAIALEESGLNPHSVGYNCRYKIGGTTYDKLTHLYIDLNTVTKERLPGYVSTWCRSGHEKFAWSKDGSIFQINNPTPHEMTIEGNLEKARHKYETQGLDAWVSYKTDRYKKHLEKANELVKQVL